MRDAMTFALAQPEPIITSRRIADSQPSGCRSIVFIVL
jgi:hypothetical protein